MGKRGEDAEKETGRPAARKAPAEKRGATGRGTLGTYKGDPLTGSRSRTLMRLLPVVLLVAGVVFDEAAPPRFNASPLYAAAPLIAAPFFSLLYAVQETPHGVRLLVGDVRGKGLGAVEAVAVVIGAFREAAEQESSLEKVAQRLERALAREGVRREGLDQFEGFTTALLAEIPPGQSVVRTVNRGHPEPLLLHGDGDVRVLVPTQPALPLGMGDLGVWPDRSDATPFPSGATLLLFTDGLTEARDRNGVFYDPAERLTGRRFEA
ncbi:membrane protein, partial [Streptomyces sp. NRRL F-6602]